MLKQLIEWVKKLFKKEEKPWTSPADEYHRFFRDTIQWVRYQSDAVLIVLERILVEWPEIRKKLNEAYERGAFFEEMETIRKRVLLLTTAANNFVGVHLMAMATFLDIGEPSSLYVDDLLTYKFDIELPDIRTRLAEELVALDDIHLRIVEYLNPEAYEHVSNIRLKDAKGLLVYW